MENNKDGKGYFMVSPESIIELIGLPKEIKCRAESVHYDYTRAVFNILVEGENLPKAVQGCELKKVIATCQNKETNIKNNIIKDLHYYDEHNEICYVFKNKNNKVKVEIEEETWEFLKQKMKFTGLDIDSIIKK
jgi:hypothetical protein